MFTNTKNHLESVNARTAVLQGLASDGGLFLPTAICSLPLSSSLAGISYAELAAKILSPYFVPEIPQERFEELVSEAFSFPVPLHILDEQTSVLELFHGPTCAFKDFGARFLARTMGYWSQGETRETVVLVATSGDTGSAVAQGFFGVAGIRVVILYPSGKISKVQEQQMTTLGGNVTAIELRGTFDDCQSLVKQAFVHPELSSLIRLTSANSINIGRLLPQSVYYYWAALQSRLLTKSGTDPLSKPYFVVPSGNLGNLTAGLISKIMGLEVPGFLASSNSNDTFPRYLQSGEYEPKPSIHTLSNAMDVGNPNNQPRIESLFGADLEKMRAVIQALSCTEKETMLAINDVFQQFGYLIDPHTAVGYSALAKLRKGSTTAKAGVNFQQHSIILGTAHPAKFSETVLRATGNLPELPTQLASCMGKPKRAIPLANRFKDFADYLYSLAE